MSKPFIELKYDIKKDEFSVNSDMKKDKIADIVSEFIRSQMGKGEDRTEANILDIYKITMYLDLSSDVFRCSHNCENLGLRDGILLDFIRRH